VGSDQLGDWSLSADHYSMPTISLTTVHCSLLTVMRQNISGGSPFEPIIGFSRAVRVGNSVHLAGTGPVGAEGEDAAGQTRRIFKIAAEALSKAGATFEHVVRTRIYLTHVEDWEAVGRVHGEFFSSIRPAATMVVVAALLNPAWRVEIEMDAIVEDAAPGP
jgi:enamine deaminase RidA (YjgF/YER057c/UK114 family)